MGSQLRLNPYHVDLIRVALTRAIPDLIPDLQDEMTRAFEPVSGSSVTSHRQVFERISQRQLPQNSSPRVHLGAESHACGALTVTFRAEVEIFPGGKT